MNTILLHSAYAFTFSSIHFRALTKASIHGLTSSSLRPSIPWIDRPFQVRHHRQVTAIFTTDRRCSER